MRQVRIDMERKQDDAVAAARAAEKDKAEQTISDLRGRLQVRPYLRPLIAPI